jgi:hypothetical protein
MNLYNPVLTGKSQKTKTYLIANLFYIALFGGVFALTIMGLINSRMLQIKGTRFYALILASFLFISAKISFYILDVHHMIPLDYRFGYSLFKLPDLLLFPIYYHTLKVPYRLHMIYHAVYYHMSHRGKAIFVCLLGNVLDFIIILYFYR